MKQMFFPKPPPADPLPLEVWIERTDRAEVGRESFFRGRDKEYEVFRGAVGSLREGLVGGGTMIFQGAPGAGKSALVGECMEAVRRHSTPKERWIAVSIKTGSLRFPDRVVRAMVNAANTEIKRLRKSSSGSIKKTLKGVHNLGKQALLQLPNLDIKVAGVSWSKKDRDLSVEGLFEHVASFLKDFRIVVFVDEAQNTSSDIMTKGVIECLHDPPADISLITAFFGLSDTEMVLEECGLSRLPDKRVVNLEQLSHADASSAIRGVFDAYNFAGTPEDRESWIDSLADLSQGWPQHINRVSVAAAEVIQEHGGKIIMEHLESARTRGRKRMNVYYAKRLAAGHSRDWVYRELALTAKENDGVLSVDDIEIITEFVREKESQTLNDFLTKALHAGLLAPARNSSSRYRIPIPSLGDYLRSLEDKPPPQYQK